MAVVERAESDVVPELGVPLNSPVISQVNSLLHVTCRHREDGVIESSYGPISDGVTGSDGGGGKLISVGVVMMRRCEDELVAQQSQ